MKNLIICLTLLFVVSCSSNKIIYKDVPLEESKAFVLLSGGTYEEELREELNEFDYVLLANKSKKTIKAYMDKEASKGSESKIYGLKLRTSYKPNGKKRFIEKGFLSVIDVDSDMVLSSFERSAGSGYLIEALVEDMYKHYNEK